MDTPTIELVALKDGEEIGRWSLDPGVYTIGSSPSCSISLSAEGVEAEHASILIAEDGGISIESQASGVSVDGEPVVGSSVVSPNQTISIGSVQIVLQQRIESDTGSDLSLATGEQDGLPREFKNERYQVGDEIAKGGMGAILNARQNAVRRSVAMKVILGEAQEDPRHRLRFIEEAQITAQLEHPNIVPVHDAGIDAEGRVFYTMKMVKGIDLKKILDLLKKGVKGTVEKYQLPALLTIFQKVCDAVAFAHSRGVIHRDLKPANIMIGSYGEVLVMDWGLAKVIGRTSKKVDPANTGPTLAAINVESARHDERDAYATMEGSVVGTLAYMAPEQARGEVDKLDPRTDIFALGCVLYEILTLSRPFPGKKQREILERILSGEAPIPPVALTARKHIDASKLPHLAGGTVPESLSAVTMRALAFEPRARYNSVRCFQDDLTNFQNGFATSAEKAGTWKQAKLFVKRNRSVSLAVLIALVMLFGTSMAFTLRVLTERNRSELALANLRRTAPTFAEQAVSLVAAQHLDLALEKLEFALTIDPKNLAYLRQHADLLQASLRFDEASAAYRRVLILNPGDPHARLNLSLCENLHTDLEPDPAALRRLYDALREQGRDIEAIPLGQQLGVGAAVTDAIKAAFGNWTELPSWTKTKLRIEVEPGGGITLNLADLPLQSLERLAVLNGLPIHKLRIGNTGITNLSPVADFPLVELDISYNPISDLTPVAKMPLRRVVMNKTLVRSLEPLRGMLLKSLVFGNGNLTSLEPLRGMPLESLIIFSNPKLTAIEPVVSTPVKEIDINGCTGIRDVAVLLKAPSLISLVALISPASEVLRNHPTLRLLGRSYESRKPVAEFWAGYDAKKAADKK